MFFNPEYKQGEWPGFRADTPVTGSKPSVSVGTLGRHRRHVLFRERRRCGRDLVLLRLVVEQAF
mgnify:CR=1 FL=1